ncbi:tubulin--tyrosine ligase-like protein 12 isoform X2 [Parasteatoda tepidariorum]|uniref:tubulin--tyrosine ligase-like protein 12 isoform X2 n=1 Tax=Parasteatoda tepidariorum TaxID=114398 RepID=UPI001C727162|nr:tubulin--tyrosine ligase-like protein 12 isoform X2 [Parasteatoda tepidariorum]
MCIFFRNLSTKSMANEFDDLFENFVSTHEQQLKKLAIPQSKWKHLFKKLNLSSFDAGNDFIYSQVSDDDENSEEEGGQLRVFTKYSMDPDDDDHIYLIDHAFTYTLNIARTVLAGLENLLDRMCNIMNVSQENLSKEEKINIVLSKMWKFNNSYVVKNSEQDESFVRWWYIMDEFGSAIRHSEEPNFIIVPFFYAPDSVTYSLLFPKVSVLEGEEVTCCYPRFQMSMLDEMKAVLKYPWEKCDLSYIDFNQTEPDFEYLTSGRVVEELPDIGIEIPNLLDIKKIKVYTDYPEVSEFLTIPRFYFTNEKSEAHILWLAGRVYDYRQLAESSSNSFYVNQFPSEQVLINKDLLAIVCRRSAEGASFDPFSMESFPTWLPTTFSLLTELPKFVSYFQNREKRNLDNTWICKPFNLARGLDIYVTDNLDQIIRLTEIRPMVACKYISDPVLFPRENKGLVKMDLRFIVLLKSIQNFELFVYKRFWLRFANKPFSLDNFEDYEKHFTVMNYSEFPLQQMFCHDFIERFENHYSCYKWNDIEYQQLGL